MSDWREEILIEAAGGPKAKGIKNVFIPVRRKAEEKMHPCKQCGNPTPLNRILCPTCFKKKRKKR